MPALPKIPRGFITNFQGAVPDFVEHTQFIFLLVASALIVLTTSIFLIGIGGFHRPKPQPFPNAEFTFSSTSWEAKYNDYLEKARTAGDPGQAAVYFQKALFTLSADYNRAPSSQKREFLIKLAAFIKTNYPEYSQSVDFEIPCRQTSCGAVFSYSEGLAQIKSGVEAGENLNPQLKEAILINLENAALAAGKGDNKQEFTALTSVFGTLKGEWQRSQDENIKILAEKTLALMKEVDTQSYQAGQEVELYKL
ncbi:hypothetical protein A3D07_01255 [Candidatus Curtissbacteria bacterium RIFCSPHIGHO2_02_FULL_42_15]|uniref:Uncharacterized protein n=1 Tax=Candidatus Curtissbacteria bacterium RIFCSPHIGHO2_02_FULL_42_15 TaxID=1797716 RepID=A0A1F5GGK6_9BACT|nr:MAG: hypothetical protein A3D07_01255 [Candidatus Curtissbacteria bacterium RIFCSPHIGHO2_02_FULL_42_15]